MNLHMIAYVVGCILEIEAVLMLLPALVGLIYGERTAMAFLICALGAAVLGAIPVLKKPKNRSIYAREGFVATALSWIVMGAVVPCPSASRGRSRIISTPCLRWSPALPPPVPAF